MGLPEFTQAHLPRELEDRTPRVRSAEFGRTYYCPPWAMWADERRLLWLHPDYTLSFTPGGTVRMRVELRADGYHVWPPAGATWEPREPSFAGRPSQSFIPVAVLHVKEGS